MAASLVSEDRMKAKVGITGSLPRVMMVIPGLEEDRASMIFVRRQVDAVERAGLPLRRFFLRSRVAPLMLGREVLRFRAEVRAFGPDLIHAQYGTMTAFFCAVATSHPLAITFRGSDLNPAQALARWRTLSGRLLSQIASLRARRVICVSKQLRDRLWRTQLAHEALVVPVAVDTTLFKPMSQAEARARLGWRPDGKVVIFNAGRRAKGKRQDLAEAGVEAARRIVQDQDLRLFVIDGFQPPELVPCLLNAADCIVLTSDFEGSPNIVKEALACCLPVVSVDAGDVKERISAVHPSLIVGREPRQIGAGIAEILRLGVRSNGYDVIRRELSEGAMVKVLLDFYRQFMGS